MQKYQWDAEQSPRIVAALVDWRAYVDALPAGEEKDKEGLVLDIWHAWVAEIAELGWGAVVNGNAGATTSWLYGIGKGGRYLGGGFQELRGKNDALDIANRMRATGWPRAAEAADFLLECWRTGRYWSTRNPDANGYFKRNHDDLASAANDFPTMEVTLDDDAQTVSWELHHEMWPLKYRHANLVVHSCVTTEEYNRGETAAVHDISEQLTGSMTYAEVGITPAEGWGMSLHMSTDGGNSWSWRGHPKTPWGRLQMIGSTRIDDSVTEMPTFTLRGRPFDPHAEPGPGWRWDLWRWIKDKPVPYVAALLKENKYAERFEVLNAASAFEWRMFLRYDAVLEHWLDPETKVDLQALKDEITIKPVPPLYLRGQPLPMYYQALIEEIPIHGRGDAVLRNIAPRLNAVNALSDADYELVRNEPMFDDLFLPRWETEDAAGLITGMVESAKALAAQQAYDEAWEREHGPSNPGPGSITRPIPAQWTGKGKAQLAGGHKAMHRAMFTNLRVTQDPEAGTYTAAWDDRPSGYGWEFTVEWQPMAGTSWTPSDGGPVHPVVLRIEE